MLFEAAARRAGEDHAEHEEQREDSGDRVFFEPGEDHWHGAAPSRFMTHLAVLDVDDQGNTAIWGDHVSDAEYSAAPEIGEW